MALWVGTLILNFLSNSREIRFIRCIIIIHPILILLLQFRLAWSALLTINDAFKYNSLIKKNLPYRMSYDSYLCGNVVY